MAKIQAPNKEYNGVSATVIFVNGVGECNNPALLAWFEEHGYTVDKTKPDKGKDKPPAKPEPDKGKIPEPPAKGDADGHLGPEGPEGITESKE